MKLVFSSIARLFFSYSKFLSTLVLMSTLGTTVIASEPKYTYLKCDDRYYRLSGNFLLSNYNIRTKKFKNHHEVRDYKTNYIRISNGYIINRNIGEYKNSKGDVICQFEVINLKDLPKDNDEGKLF